VINMPRRVRRLLFTICFIAGLLAPPVVIELFNFPISRRQIQRVTSPDGHLDAVAMAVRSGILTPQLWYKVYLVHHGATLRGAAPVFSAIRVESAQLGWPMRRLLEISYARAGIEHFQNYWLPPDEKNTLVGVRLAPTSSSFSYLNATGSIDGETNR